MRIVVSDTPRIIGIDVTDDSSIAQLADGRSIIVPSVWSWRLSGKQFAERTMKQIDMLFDLMDTWRHFPNYQLERRADIFFALYLSEVLEAKLGFPMRPELAPEFPVRIGTIYPNIPTDKSYKIDYVALSGAADKAVFVELKTEGLSRRPEQDKYLLAAQEIGLAGLLEGLLDIFRATNSKRKYFCLLEHLEDMDLMHIPISMKEIMARPTLQGANGASRQIEIRTTAAKSHVVYIQPTGIGPGIISFHEFAEVVQKYDDPVSRRFAKSLREWAEVQAGEASASNRS
jgi:hypothetical protein